MPLHENSILSLHKDIDKDYAEEKDIHTNIHTDKDKDTNKDKDKQQKQHKDKDKDRDRQQQDNDYAQYHDQANYKSNTKTKPKI